MHEINIHIFEKKIKIWFFSWYMRYIDEYFESNFFLKLILEYIVDMSEHA